MGPSNMFFSSSSPTVVLPPPPPPHQQSALSSSPMAYTNPSPFNASASWPQLPPPATSSPFPVSRGRKRSRDESDIEDDGSLSFAAPSQPTAVAEPEPIFGEGMTLLQPNGFLISAGSQTGTWAEETADSRPPPSPPSSTTEPPRLMARKSQRLDTTSSFAAPSTPPISCSPTSAHTEPQIDYSTILLGIGWTALSSPPTSTPADDSAAAALRGWTRYLANHYPLSNPTILLRSAGLSAYLVHADEGFFLFREDLDEGQLVGRTEGEALQNLRKSPVVRVEGSEILRAVGTPKANGGVGVTATEAGGMELD